MHCTLYQWNYKRPFLRGLVFLDGVLFDVAGSDADRFVTAEEHVPSQARPWRGRVGEMSERMETISLELFRRFALELSHDLPDVSVTTGDHGVYVIGQYRTSAETIP